MTADNDDKTRVKRRIGIRPPDENEPAGDRYIPRESVTECWRDENAEAITTSNIYIDANGVPLARHRQF